MALVLFSGYVSSAIYAFDVVMFGWSAEVAIRALYPTMAGGIDPLDTTGLEEQGNQSAGASRSA